VQRRASLLLPAEQNTSRYPIAERHRGEARAQPHRLLQYLAFVRRAEPAPMTLACWGNGSRRHRANGKRTDCEPASVAGFCFEATRYVASAAAATAAFWKAFPVIVAGGRASGSAQRSIDILRRHFPTIGLGELVRNPYGDVFIRRLRAMSIRDRPTAPRSPWQNGHCERAIGSIRRECLDDVVVFGERHLRHLLARTFQSTRTRRRREQYIPLVAFCLHRFLAHFIICMCEFDFRQAQVEPVFNYAIPKNVMA
jgi:Integrase core domain